MHFLEQSLLELFPRERWCGTRILLAVSGGADSVALLRAMHRLAATAQAAEWLNVAHFNHGWRGIESDGDEAFVRTLCGSLSLPLEVGRNEVETTTRPAPSAKNPSEEARSEEAARLARYDFLTKTAYRVGARYVVTAHTASDRVETLLHNLFRGAGLAGVAGPATYRTLDKELLLVRPLLNCSRNQVEEYLSLLKKPYRVDSSNADQKYRRNFLRHSLLPLLRTHYGEELDERLCGFSRTAAEAVEVHRELARDYLASSQKMWQAEWAAAFGSWQQETGRQQIVLPRAHKLEIAWPIVFQALQQEWHRLNWPLQNMSREHWQQVREAWSHAPFSTEINVQSASPRRLLDQLPGDLSLAQLPDWLIIK